MAFKVLIWERKEKSCLKKPYGMRKARKENLICSSRSISACRQPACILTSYYQLQLGMRKMISILPTCIHSFIRFQRRLIQLGKLVVIGKFTKDSPKNSQSLRASQAGSTAAE